ncbi:helix-turn-helix domain-containing protein [Konateibacter massiliensis]|uniref:helix-turn-helix domain-containing protein n=1 Tax=Konateibacter massiliensis TaxID=2002841 RepID=UPI000C159E9E|nr:helix-turn-helix transcriptional regulator [Konateibacter massiliensis]
MIKGMADKLKQLRVENGLSQKEVSNILEVSPSIISGYETGERTPSLENLLALSYLYKCSTDYLLGRNQDKPSVTIDVSNLNQEQIHALHVLIKTIKA